MRLIVSGQLVLSARDVDAGVAITFSSKNADVVERLQTEVPRLVEAYNEGAGTVNPEQMRAANRLLASGKVKIEVEPGTHGITVRVASDDPQLVKQIKALLPAYFQGLSQRARMMERMQQMPGGPMRGRPLGQGQQGPGPQGPMGRQGGGQGGGRMMGPQRPFGQ